MLIMDLINAIVLKCSSWFLGNLIFLFFLSAENMQTAKFRISGQKAISSFVLSSAHLKLQAENTEARLNSVNGHE